MESVTRAQVVVLALMLVVIVVGVWLGANGTFTICMDCNNPPLRGT